MPSCLPRSSRGRAVLLTPLGSVHPTPLPFCNNTAPACPEQRRVNPLFAPLLPREKSRGAKSVHPLHSSPLTLPLFSTTCSLFCSHQKLISFLFNRLPPLFQKHRGVGVVHSFQLEISCSRTFRSGDVPTCRRSCSLTPLESADPQNVPVTPLECADPKTRSCKIFRMRSCKKRGWRGSKSSNRRFGNSLRSR